MEFLMDNPEVEKTFKAILKAIPSMQNGETAASLEKRGFKYEQNYGCSVVDLKHFASQFERDHLLALKLWNKKWRETMILATLLDEPAKVNEEQMDFWVKTTYNIEIIEQAVFNLLTETPYAFVKALEWCRGKKMLVKHAGLLMMGRLALTSKNSIDEMFEPFFEVLPPLTKDALMHQLLFRSVCQLARHSTKLHQQCVSFAECLLTFEEVAAHTIGHELINELKSEGFKNLIK
jgi:hypothetical protein